MSIANMYNIDTFINSFYEFKTNVNLAVSNKINTFIVVGPCVRMKYINK